VICQARVERQIGLAPWSGCAAATGAFAFRASGSQHSKAIAANTAHTASDDL
jgi:hypothetical protein